MTPGTVTSDSETDGIAAAPTTTTMTTTTRAAVRTTEMTTGGGLASAQADGRIRILGKWEC